MGCWLIQVSLTLWDLRPSDTHMAMHCWMRKSLVQVKTWCLFSVPSQFLNQLRVVEHGQHWCRSWLGTRLVPSHYLHQWYVTDKNSGNNYIHYMSWHAIKIQLVPLMTASDITIIIICTIKLSFTFHSLNKISFPIISVCKLPTSFHSVWLYEFITVRIQT